MHFMPILLYGDANREREKRKKPINLLAVLLHRMLLAASKNKKPFNLTENRGEAPSNTHNQYNKNA